MSSKRRSKLSRTRKHGTRKTPQYSRLTAKERAAYDRTTNLVTDLRNGVGPYKELLRKHKLSAPTARKYGGHDIIGGTRGKPVRASKTDRRARLLMFPKAVGDVPVLTRSSRDATKLSEFFRDRDKLLHGDLSAEDFETKWQRVEVAGQEVFAHSAAVLEMADADVLKLEHLYASTGGAQ
jgi:hypothetical protein